MTQALQDPFVWFEAEYQKAVKAQLKDPNAMQLATLSRNNKPRVRTVLYKGLLRGGFSFYSNYESAKAQELEHSNQAALLFFWASLERQIRVEGEVFKLTRTESEAYFKTRGRLSQIGAWASEQSHTIENFEVIEKKVQSYEEKFKNQEVPCPTNWGGYHLIPMSFEFWVGRAGRLHERTVFERQSVTEAWKVRLLSP